MVREKFLILPLIVSDEINESEACLNVGFVTKMKLGKITLNLVIFKRMTNP